MKIRKIHFILPVAILFFTSPLWSQHVGIGTENPTAMLDINGDVVMRTSDLPVTDSVNLALDVNTEKFSSYRITDADSAFSVGGITAGMDGRLITLINETDFPMELISEDSAAIDSNRIVTGDKENLILEHMGTVNLQYDTAALKWIVIGNNQVPAGAAVWDTSGTSIFYDDNVGIGTSDPVSPLTIQTDSSSIGLTQIGGPDSITLVTRINEESATIGTTSLHVLGLSSGGNDKMLIWPDGHIVVGNNIGLGSSSSRGHSRTAASSEFTMRTPINSGGWEHIGGDDEIIVREAIGGVSAAIGTSTNHTFRLMTRDTGRVQILDDGRVTISPNNYAPQGQLTVYTKNNENGIVQVGGDGQIIAMRIGGSSAGIGTYTPHIMRIIANGIAAINIDPAGNIAMGLNDPLPGYKVSINGSVKAKELVIETIGWPDYVFEKDHSLLPLNDVAQFIQQHKHLPNIPSAAEIETNGLGVGEMQKKMMEKIEELTLYLIQQQKTIEELQENVAELKK